MENFDFKKKMKSCNCCTFFFVFFILFFFVFCIFFCKYTKKKKNLIYFNILVWRGNFDVKKKMKSCDCRTLFFVFAFFAFSTFAYDIHWPEYQGSQKLQKI